MDIECHAEVQELHTYDKDDGASLEKIAFETFFNNPLGRVHVESG